MSDDFGDDWEPGWEGHERQQRRQVLRLTPTQRLEWLEAAIAFVYKVEASRRRQSVHAGDAESDV